MVDYFRLLVLHANAFRLEGEGWGNSQIGQIQQYGGKDDRPLHHRIDLQQTTFSSRSLYPQTQIAAESLIWSWTQLCRSWTESRLAAVEDLMLYRHQESHAQFVPEDSPVNLICCVSWASMDLQLLQAQEPRLQA